MSIKSYTWTPAQRRTTQTDLPNYLWSKGAACPSTKRPSSWWLNQPNWNIWSSNWIIFPNFRGEILKTSFSCQHLAFHADVLVLQSSSPPFSRPSAPSPRRRSFDHQTRSRIEAVELGAVRWYLAVGWFFSCITQPRGYSVLPVCSYVVFVFWAFSGLKP